AEIPEFDSKRMGVTVNEQFDSCEFDAEPDETFTRKQILDAVAAVVPDELFTFLYNDKGKEVRSAKSKGKGDTLSLFVMREIVSLTQEDDIGEEELEDLRRAFDRAINELADVRNALYPNNIADASDKQ